MARVATVPGLAQLRVAPAAHFARSLREEVSTGLRITSLHTHTHTHTLLVTGSDAPRSTQRQDSQHAARRDAGEVEADGGGSAAHAGPAGPSPLRVGSRALPQ